MEGNKKYVVLITGFGPFGNHVINASWEAVKELKKLCTNSQEMVDVEIIIKEIPVSYQDVAACLPKLWKEYKPMVNFYLRSTYNLMNISNFLCFLCFLLDSYTRRGKPQSAMFNHRMLCSQ